MPDGIDISPKCFVGLPGLSGQYQDFDDRGDGQQGEEPAQLAGEKEEDVSLKDLRTPAQ